MVRGWWVRSGWVVERLAFIVVALAADKTGVAPRLDRAGGHAELVGQVGPVSRRLPPSTIGPAGPDRGEPGRQIPPFRR